MSARFNKRQPYQRSWVEAGYLNVETILGELLKFSIESKREYKDIRNTYIEDVFVYLEDEETVFICRYDTTYSIYRKSDRLLLEFGVVSDIDRDMFFFDYKTIGYRRYKSTLEVLILEDSNKRVIHSVPGPDAKAHHTYILPTAFESEVDLTRAYRLVHAKPELALSELFIYTKHGRYPTTLIKEWRHLV